LVPGNPGEPDKAYDAVTARIPKLALAAYSEIDAVKGTVVLYNGLNELDPNG
jgi:hypothetical protein